MNMKMNAKMNTVMTEVARLTRSGQLREATSLLQQAMNSAGPVQNAASSAFDPLARLNESFKLRTTSLDDKIVNPTQAEGARFTTSSYRNSAGSRSYKLFVPSGYHGEPIPLIVMLHGGSQDPDDFALGTRMNELAEEHTCLVAYPAQPASANLTRCWNWFKPQDQVRDRGEPSIIAGITSTVCAGYAVDPKRIFIAGMSAGGAMAATLALSYPELFAAVGIHSGLPPKAAHDLPSAMMAMSRGNASAIARQNGVSQGAKPVRAIVFHGDRDTTVHHCNGIHLIEQFTQARTDGGPTAQTSVDEGQVPRGHAYTRTIYRDANGRTGAEYWLIHGAGHAWSGGSSSGSYTNPRGPDATKEMLRFFLESP